MPFVLFITWLVAITVIYILWYLCKLIYATLTILIPYPIVHAKKRNYVDNIYVIYTALPNAQIHIYI